MTKQDKIKLLIEKTLNEVRLPTGFFIVTNQFTFPGHSDGWDIVFAPNEIVKLDPSNKSVQGLSPSSKKWSNKEISLPELMKPEKYRMFMSNARKLTPAEVKEKGLSDSLEFTTTVRAMPKRAHELDLEPNTKVNVKVID